ncbi:MAG: hypothetical protein NVS4B9_02200 [Ktedonobacteraceae bacterium]
MNSFDTLQVLFSQDISELQQLQKRRWFYLSTTRVVKEQHLGRCCYFAEEFLSSTELCAFKKAVGLNEQQWRAYKAKVSGL